MTDRDPLPYNWTEIRRRLQGAIWDLLDRLDLKHELQTKTTRSIWPRNPMRNDRKPGSFVIWTCDGYAGAWKDFALSGPDGKGDIFDLIAGCERLQSKIDVYWWALDFLNLDRKGSNGSPRTKAMVDQERERRERDRAAAEARDAALGEAKSAELFRLWLSLPSIAGTIAESYLREARRIDLSRLPKLPGALRYADRVDYVDPETGEVTEWRHVMVTAMTRGRKVAALHRTYLKPDGSGKADMVKPKLMIGPVRGTAIRLSHGPSGLSPIKAAAAGKTGPLAIGEGIETCLTVACARPDYRVWAAGSLSLMGLLDWPACASAVVLLGENDWKPEARKAFGLIEAHWRQQAEGRRVEVVNSAVGSDFNDWAKAG